MNYVEIVHSAQFLTEVPLAAVHIDSFFFKVEVISHGLTEFHLELDAVVKAEDVVSRTDDLWPDSEQGKEFVKAELFEAPFQLQLLNFIEVIFFIFLVNFLFKGNSFDSVLFVLNPDKGDSSITSFSNLLCLRFLISIM